MIRFYIGIMDLVWIQVIMR